MFAQRALPGAFAAHSSCGEREQPEKESPAAAGAWVITACSTSLELVWGSGCARDGGWRRRACACTSTTAFHGVRAPSHAECMRSSKCSRGLHMMGEGACARALRCACCIFTCSWRPGSACFARASTWRRQEVAGSAQLVRANALEADKKSRSRRERSLRERGMQSKHGYIALIRSAR